VVIGGIAAGPHGVPRATFDLDILIEATVENARRRLNALKEAGFGTAALTSAEGVAAHEVAVFNDYARIDVQTSTPRLEFAEDWASREAMTHKGQEFYMVSGEGLIQTKRAAGREVDIADVRTLGKEESA